MAKQLSIGFRALVFAATFAAGVQIASADWHNFRVTVHPAGPTTDDTISLVTRRWFGDPGFDELSTSISISGNQIDLDILIQDLHTGPFVFPQVVVEHSTMFGNIGPLGAGQYQVNAQMWITPWPLTGGGTLLDTAGLVFTVAGVGVGHTIPGDYNGDGTVDAGDYAVWRNMAASTGAGLAADGDGNGIVDDADYDMWRAHHGESMHGTAAASPEPGGFILLLLATALTWLHRAR